MVGTKLKVSSYQLGICQQKWMQMRSKLIAWQPAPNRDVLWTKVAPILECRHNAYLWLVRAWVRIPFTAILLS